MQALYMFMCDIYIYSSWYVYTYVNIYHYDHFLNLKGTTNVHIYIDLMGDA